MKSVGQILDRFSYFMEPVFKPPLNIARGNRKIRQMALTFDGDIGPDSLFSETATDHILETLEQRSIRCTFFLTGRFIDSNPQLTRRISELGHEVGSHTYNHPHLHHLSSEDFVLELEKTESAYQAATGHSLAKLWRAPYGEFHRGTWRIAVSRGYRHVFWTTGRSAGRHFDSLDWIDDPASERFVAAADICRRFISSPHKNGAIALFHLGARSPDPFHEHLPGLVDGLLAQDFQLVPVSVLSS